jgi:hypothetical protein
MRNDGRKATAAASSPPSEAGRRVADDADRLHHRPGVSCPKATALRNSAWVIQPYASTASACMSGMITKPPP